MSGAPLRVRWLGRVPYAEALAVQRALRTRTEQHLLLLEHPPTYTLGVRADPAHVLASLEPAEVVHADRGGDITFHGPGQLVGYPIVSVAGRRGGGMADTRAYVASLERLIIDAIADLGVHGAFTRSGFPGVWVDPAAPRKIAAIGVRLDRGRSMHGFALNVDTDLTWFDRIVPCGIADHGVTSLAAEGCRATMRDVVDAIADRAAATFGADGMERQDVVWRHAPDDLSAFSRGAGPGEPVRLTGRLSAAGVSDGLAIATRKPDWMRVKADFGPRYRQVRSTVADLGLATVCQEAGCPNIFECWNEGTATFMVLGERCTRACGFCLVDTRRPLAVDHDEPRRVAEAVVSMRLEHVVLTMVARDDLVDGGMAHVAQCVEAIRVAAPHASVETLVSDARGDADALGLLFAARPDVLNHNVETVPRLQRAVRPSAGYARSLSVLARAKAAGLTTKSGLVVGMGETDEEVHGTLADLAAIGVDIVTIGQYLRPTSHHVPIHRWVEPDVFVRFARIGEALGIGHVESSPLTRSSYHAASSAQAVEIGRRSPGGATARGSLSS